MRLRAIVALSFACSGFGLAQAENLNLNEKADTTSVYLTPYSIGLGIGGLAAINQELMNQTDMILKLQISQNFRFMENWDVGTDLEWWLPGAANFGGVVNLNYEFGSGSFRPFIGAGAGLQYIDHPNYRFGDNLGFEGMGQIGMFFDVTDQIHLRIRVPFQVVTDKDIDRGAGLDLALFFSSPQSGTKVKKLKY